MALPQDTNAYEFSSSELKSITGWDDILVEDYLNIRREISKIITGTNTEILNVENNITVIEQKAQGDASDSKNRAQIMLLRKSLATLEATVTALEATVALLQGLVNAAQGTNMIYSQLLRIRSEMDGMIAGRVSLGS